jgi:serine-threonine kinase receptor-associated protein
MEKKLRIFDLDRVDTSANGNGLINGNTNGASDHKTITADMGFEVGAGVHGGTIKSIVWTHDPNILVTAADDKTIRWWDLQTQSVVQQQSVQGDIGSCEFTNIKGEPGDIGGGLPILAIAAGKTVYFYGGVDARTLIRSITLPYDVASVALHPIQRKFVTGGMKDTWAKVYDYDSEQEIGRQSSLGLTLMLTYCRCTQRSSRSDLEHQLLPRRQALRHWE